jgi:AraC-like DNA-binding protein
MDNSLLAAVRRYVDHHPARDGVFATPIPGLAIVRETRPTPLQFALFKPLVALLLQGNKRVTLGTDTFDFGAGESLLITTDVPTVSQVTRASVEAPYFSLVMELDAAIIEGLVAELGSTSSAASRPMRVDPTDAEVADTALRLIRLLDRPSHLAVLQTQMLRELHLWLLSGRHGGAIQSLGVADSHERRIGRATALIRADYCTPLRIERLAAAAGMSSTTFHERFRAVTSLTPLQFQKQLRLMEARRILVSEGAMIATAAYQVGYESVTQFTREYGRMFGMPPARDVKAAKTQMHLAA